MYSMEALSDVLVEKGLVTKEEVLKRIEEVVEKRVNNNKEDRLGFSRNIP